MAFGARLPIGERRSCHDISTRLPASKSSTVRICTVPRSQTPVWERLSAKLCFASGRGPETEFPGDAFPNRVWERGANWFSKSTLEVPRGRSSSAYRSVSTSCHPLPLPPCRSRDVTPAKVPNVGNFVDGFFTRYRPTQQPVALFRPADGAGAVAAARLCLCSR